jgi:aminoglycoside 2''-phosphotransferase
MSALGWAAWFISRDYATVPVRQTSVMDSTSERLDPEQARELLGRAFPSLRPTRLTRPSGFSEFDAWDVDDTWMARIAHAPEFADKLLREKSLIDRIAGSFPIAVPRIELWFDGPTIALHRKIPGTPGDDGGRKRPSLEARPGITRQLGEFLTILHATPLAVGDEVGLPREALVAPERLVEQLRDVAVDLANAELPSEARAYLAGEVPIPGASSDLVVLHGDIKGEHLLFDPAWRLIVGVIDWADVAIGDPVNDVARLVSWLGRSFTTMVLEHYAGATESLLERAIFYARTRNLIALADRLAGRNDWPVPIAQSLVRYAFS